MGRIGENRLCSANKGVQAEAVADSVELIAPAASAGTPTQPKMGVFVSRQLYPTTHQEISSNLSATASAWILWTALHRSFPPDIPILHVKNTHTKTQNACTQEVCADEHIMAHSH